MIDSLSRAKIFGERVKRLREEKRLSQKDFAAKMGTSGGFVSEVEQGKKAPGSDFIYSLKRVFGVDLNWMLAEEIAEPEVQYAVTHIFEPKKASGEVRTVGVYALVGAGPARDFSQMEPLEQILVPNGFAKPSIVAVKVKGDSMAPLILEGAYVGVDRDDRDLVSGKIYAVWIPHEGAVIKRVFVGPVGLALRSENPAHPEYSIPEDEVSPGLVLGRVRWVIQEF